ncbi:hypothetical protein Vadar_030377 [Vaccinium darrowii]|uniref:Uncharacterized protein n=1 Tax=Vaccinium darrowii TaxID=229202 RepID=A0ACB7YZY3_9ERIC|nr:hypothetical protein Vadar_030377 [Vaccinium darrowii]
MHGRNTHSLVEATIIEVKSSFERTLSTWKHPFMVLLFDNIRGVVSQSALQYLEMELKKIDSVMESTSPCLCPIRHTHGLPCAHEIVPFKKKEEPLPLSVFHQHWKKLSLEKPKKDPTIAKTMKANLEIFMEKFCTYDEDHQRHVMRKMAEVIHPDSTSLIEPQQKANLYMRPSSPMPPIALNWDIYREPYAKGWEPLFASRIEEFGRIIGSDVATAEDFDITQ